MKATAEACGAATIINAIATGKGAAFGIKLRTKATVELDGSGEFTAEIKGFPGEDTRLIELCARRALESFGLRHGAKITTESDIPIAAGLKSSSTAANAVVLATLAAAEREMKDLDAINLGVDAALEAKVTITGAFDDACASYFGGYVVTDNKKRQVLRSGPMDESLKAVLFVPEKKIYTSSIDAHKTKGIAKEVNEAWETALSGDIYSAMKENGALYSKALGLDPSIAQRALDAGAIAAGLSGKGPAVVALTKDKEKDIADAWKGCKGTIIKTTVNNEKARVL